MADNEHTIVLQGVDQFSPMAKKAAENAERLDRILKSMGRDGRGLAPTPQEWARRQDAFKRETELIRKQNEERAKSAKTHREANRLIHEGAEELSFMAARYISVGYAIDKAREGFLELAKESEQLRVVQQRIGASHHQVEELEKTLNRIGETFGQSNEEVLKALEAFREAAFLNKTQFDQVLKIGPAIVEQARRFGVSSEEMAASLGSFMHSLKIAPAQAEQALGAISSAANDLNLNFEQLNRYAPQLSENMRAMGETGLPGLTKVLAVLGATREQFGSTSLAARALDQNLQQIQRGGGVMGAMGMDLEQWTGTLDRVVKQGGSVFDWYLDRIREARRMGVEWGKLFEDPKQRNFFRAIIENQEELRATQRKLMTESQNFHSGNIKDLENLDLMLKRLGREWDEAWKALAAAGGPATGVIRDLIAELREARQILERIKELSDKGFFGAARDVIVGKPGEPRFKIPSPIDVLRGMMNGPGGAPKTESTPAEHRATGGSVSAGGAYMVGERGPEPFIPSQPGSIIPNKTFTEIDLNTQRTLAVLTEMRDIMRKNELDTAGGGGGYGGGGGVGGISTGGGGKYSGMATQGIPGMPGGLGGRGASPRSMTGSAAGAEPQASGAAGGPIVGTLAEQRQRFASELQQNPALRDKVMRIMANEQGRNPEGTQSVAESMMNRALVRGTSLEQAARWFRAEKGGYYEMGNMGRGALENPRHKAILEQGLNNALAGSNISNFATDNSSGDLARRERATGKFRFRSGFGGESFFAPGTAEPGLSRKWDRWYSGVLEAERNNGMNQPALTQRPEMPTAPPDELNAEKIRDLRSELSQPITIRAQMDRGQDSQFRRATMRREVNREVREGAWNGYNDIGAA